jgi:cellulose synthase/poly-beta-1,6-N-acetylglucosamine synthase-like glycosyltransferase
VSIERISLSRQIFERFEKRKNWRRSVAISYLLIYLSYLIWRCTIINAESMGLSLTYLFAEFLGFFLGVGIVLKSWNYNHRSPKPLIQNLSVDVFIPTYKEPLHIIKRTVIAAKEIEYPHQTWILDDGKNPDLKKFADEIGVKYLSRDQNIGAKAGNLNFGLSHSKADFVMVFDADHIAMPHALDVMLGFFVDEKVGLVQTPQDFYNTDAFQYMNCQRTGALWNDQSFFYGINQPCCDSLNIAHCVGTGVVYRRKVLDEIGGIPTTTLTEDTHTSVKMNKLGYHSVYLNEVVAYGIAAADLSEYYKTRRRWSHGNIHVIKDEKIFTHKGISFHERMLHLLPFFNCIEGWQQLLLLNIPILTLIFGLAPFEISVFNVMITFFFPFLSYLMLQEIGCGFSRLWTNEIFSIIRWPIYLRVSEAWFGRKLKWSSSQKNIKGEVNWRLMLPQISVLILSVSALVFAFFTLMAKGFETGPLFTFLKAKILGIFGYEFIGEVVDVHAVMHAGYTMDLVLVSGMWVIYNIIRIIFFIRKSINDSKNSHEFYRFKTSFPLTTKGFGRVLEISEEWIKYCDFAEDGSTKIGDLKSFLIHLPAKNLSLQIAVEEISNQEICGKIIWQNESDRDALQRAIYSVDWHREFRSRVAYFLTPSDLILKLFGVKSFGEKKYLSWDSFLYKGRPAMIANFIKEKTKATILLFDEIKIGSELEGVRINNSFFASNKIKIIAEENLSSLAIKGLDGASVRRYSVELK